MDLSRMYTPQDIRDLVTPALYQKFADTSIWDRVKREVIGIITSEAGAVDEGADKDVYRLPFAWLVEYVSQPLLAGASDEYVRRVQANYSKAISMIARRRTGRPEKRWTESGKIKGLSW